MLSARFDIIECMDDGGRLQAWLAMTPAERPSDELLRIDPLGLDATGRVNFLTLLDQHERFMQAVKVRVLAEIDRRDDTRLSLSQEEVSLALRVARGEATMKLKTSRTLVDWLPATLAGLTEARFSARHAEALAERTWRLEPETIPVFEEVALARAPFKTLSSSGSSSVARNCGWSRRRPRPAIRPPSPIAKSGSKPWMMAWPGYRWCCPLRMRSRCSPD